MFELSPPLPLQLATFTPLYPFYLVLTVSFFFFFCLYMQPYPYLHIRNKEFPWGKLAIVTLYLLFLLHAQKIDKHAHCFAWHFWISWWIYFRCIRTWGGGRSFSWVRWPYLILCKLCHQVFCISDINRLCKICLNMEQRFSLLLLEIKGASVKVK